MLLYIILYSHKNFGGISMNRNDNLRVKAAIYKLIFANPLIHRNVLRKKLIQLGKVDSKSKFSSSHGELIDSGKICKHKEKLFIKENISILGAIKKDGENYYVVTQNSSKRYPIDKSVASGYKTGDVLDVIIENIDENEEAIILGKSNKEMFEVKPE